MPLSLHFNSSAGQSLHAGAIASDTTQVSKYWGFTADAGAAEFDVCSLNTYLARKTPTALPQGGSAFSLHLLFSNPVFGYGSAYYEYAQTDQAMTNSVPGWFLQHHTIGFELHKVLVDKRIRVVAPSVGIGRRFMNLTYRPAVNGVIPLDTLFRHPGSFTLQAQNLVLTGGTGVYYKSHLFQKRGAREVDWGLTGSYAYSLRQGDWFLFGTRTPAPLPAARLDYYAVRLSVAVLLNR